MKPNRLYGLVRNMVTSDYKQYGIYNTSQAFMFLIDNGAVVDKQTIQKLKEDITKGKNRPYWFYFTVKKDSPLDLMIQKVHNHNTHNKKG